MEIFIHSNAIECKINILFCNNIKKLFKQVMFYAKARITFYTNSAIKLNPLIPYPSL